MSSSAPQSYTLSDDDALALLAYMDGELPPHERTRLEARLAADPGLANELAELHATVAVLAELPPVTPPRSFTLDPATVAPRPRFGWPWLRGPWRASAAAAVLVLALLVGTSLVSGIPSSSQSAQVLDVIEEPAAEEAPAAAMLAEAPPEAPAAAAPPEAPAAEEELMAEAPPEAPAAAAPPPVQEEAPASGDAVDAEAEQAEEAAIAEPAPAGAPSPATDDASAATILTEEEAEDTELGTNGAVPNTAARLAAPTGTLEMLADTADTSSPDTREAAIDPLLSTDTSSQGSNLGWWLLVGGALLVLALLLGVFWQRRQPD